jgi:addiction module HigA family antidote
MRMHNPPHPGPVLAELWLKPLGMRITAFASHIGVSRKTISEIVNGRAAITADMALRLSAAIGTSPEVWLRMQIAYDLWQAEQRPQPAIERLVTPTESAAA